MGILLWVWFGSCRATVGAEFVDVLFRRKVYWRPEVR